MRDPDGLFTDCWSQLNTGASESGRYEGQRQSGLRFFEIRPVSGEQKRFPDGSRKCRLDSWMCVMYELWLLRAAVESQKLAGLLA